MWAKILGLQHGVDGVRKRLIARGMAAAIVLTCFAGVGATGHVSSEDAKIDNVRSGEGKGDDETNSSLIWRTPESDGVNALWLFLKLFGAETPYEQLRRDVPLGNASLLDLRDVAQQRGVLTRIERPTESELREIGDQKLPVIVLIDDPRSGGSHFALVISMINDRVKLISTGDVRLSVMEWEPFMRSWSGFALVHETPAASASTVRFNGLVVVTGVLALVLYFVWCWSRQSPRNQVSKIGECVT